MAWDSVPWFIGGGAQHSPEVARLLAYAATSGAEGLVEPGDLKVSALSVPGASVNIAPGAALIRNRAAGGTSQTYVARNPIQDTVKIAATSGSKRSDLIVAQIEDPFMAGEPWQDPADPTVGPYIFTRVISNVPAGTQRLQDVPAYAGRSAVTLARIDIPASTGTITNAMITDLRRVALPRSQRELLQAQSTGGPSTTAVDPLNTSTYKAWPRAASWEVEIPEWATHAQVRGDVQSYVLKVGNAVGTLRAAFLGQVGRVSSFDENWGGSSGQNTRNSLGFAHVFEVPAAMRGTTQTLRFEGKRDGAGYIDADAFTVSLADVTFSQKAA